ncbi:MAG: HAD family phosphatase [Ruminococcus sp.]|nr:HAD family phosphatase [Ruminococcus sp.]
MKGIIFDFNGTMIFDEKFHNIAWRKFLENQIGRSVSDNEFQKYVHGRNAEATLSYFLQRNLKIEEVMMLEEEKEVIYRSLCLKSSDFKLADGLSEFLNELLNAGVPFTIATASGLKNMEFFFEQLNLSKWFEFDKVVYNDGTLPGKPEPDLFLKAADKIGKDIKKCVIFEDAGSGIEAAKRAGANMIIGVESMLNRDTLLSIGADKTIRNYCELGKFINENIV